MLDELRSGNRVVGAKQSRRVILNGAARRVFLASDAAPAVTAPLLRLCREAAVPVCTDGTMRELGQAAGIRVGAAVVTLL